MLGELSEGLHEAVGSSIQSVEVMMQLVTELVEMARLDETRLDPTREPVDLADVVAEAAVSVDGSERHHLNLDLGSGPAPVLGERGQLLRVFSNIVDNALSTRPTEARSGSGCGGRAGRSPWTSVTRVGDRALRYGPPLHPLRRIVTRPPRGSAARAWPLPLPRTGPQAGRRRHRHLRGGPGIHLHGAVARNDPRGRALRDLSSPSRSA